MKHSTKINFDMERDFHDGAETVTVEINDGLITKVLTGQDLKNMDKRVILRDYNRKTGNVIHLEKYS